MAARNHTEMSQLSRSTAADRTLYKCCDCNIYFTTMKDVMEHMCKKSSCSSSSDSPWVKEEDTQNTLFSCEKCNGWFQDHATFKEHACEKNAAEEPTSLSTDKSTSSGNPSTSSGNPSTSSGNPSIWNKQATLLLINNYEKHAEKQRRGLMRKKELWEKLSMEMKANGYNYNSEQVSGKWKSLNRAYKNTKDHNKKSGNEPKTYEFEKELDRLFADDPSVTPAVTISSSKRPRPEEDSSDNPDDDLVTPKKNNSDPDVDLEPPKKSKSRSNAKEVVGMFKTYLEEQKVRQQQDRELKEKMHTERMSVMESLVKAINKR